MRAHRGGAGAAAHPADDADFLLGVARGDERVIRQHIRRGVLANSKEVAGVTPAHVAAINDQPRALQLLRHYGASLNSPLTSSVTLRCHGTGKWLPLSVPLQLPLVDVVKRVCRALLWLPLSLFCLMSLVACVAACALAAGGCVYYLGQSWLYALACGCSSYALQRLLASGWRDAYKGASWSLSAFLPQHRTLPQGSTPLDVARHGAVSHCTLLELVADSGRPGAQPGEAKALLQAVAQGNTSTVAHFLSQGRFPDLYCFGVLPTHIACANDADDALDMLVAFGADLSLPTRKSSHWVRQLNGAWVPRELGGSQLVSRTLWAVGHLLGAALCTWPFILGVLWEFLYLAPASAWLHCVLQVHLPYSPEQCPAFTSSVAFLSAHPLLVVGVLLAFLLQAKHIGFDLPGVCQAWERHRRARQRLVRVLSAVLSMFVFLVSVLWSALLHRSQRLRSLQRKSSLACRRLMFRVHSAKRRAGVRLRRMLVRVDPHISENRVLALCCGVLACSTSALRCYLCYLCVSAAAVTLYWAVVHVAAQAKHGFRRNLRFVPHGLTPQEVAQRFRSWECDRDLARHLHIDGSHRAASAWRPLPDLPQSHRVSARFPRHHAHAEADDSDDEHMDPNYLPDDDEEEDSWDDVSEPSELNDSSDEATELEDEEEEERDAYNGQEIEDSEDDEVDHEEVRALWTDLSTEVSGSSFSLTDLSSLPRMRPRQRTAVSSSRPPVVTETDSKYLCVVCRSAEKCVEVLPCNHVVFCGDCSKLFQQMAAPGRYAPRTQQRCPMCRAEVYGYRKIFLT